MAGLKRNAERKTLKAEREYTLFVRAQNKWQASKEMLNAKRLRLNANTPSKKLM
jgi:hypothetical protein